MARQRQARNCGRADVMALNAIGKCRGLGIYGIMATLLLGTLGLQGCAKDSDGEENHADFVSNYGGRPFKGSAEGVRSQGGQANYTWQGEGRVALIEPSTDSVSLVIMADFGAEGEINFKVRGAYSDNAYRATETSGSSYFTVIDQRLKGEIDNGKQLMLFEGLLEKERADISLKVTFLEEVGTFPKDATLDLTLRTTRDASPAAGDGAGCQMRLVPIWSPSGMTMGMVPDC